MVEICSIGSLLERKRTKAKDKYHNVPVYAVTNNRGFVLSSSLHDFDIFSDDTSNYMVVSKNDFAYNPSRLNVGSIAYFKEEGNGLISPMYVVFHADENKILAEYLYIVIKSEFVRNKIDALKEVGARFRFDFNRWGLIKIPIPSLEEQTRIVGILDTFTSAIDNLKEQIAQRRKQYEYYRDQLLDLEGKPGVEMKTLGEVIISLKTGLNPRKNFILNEVGSNKPYITGKDIFANRINVTDKTDMINEIAVKLINRRACLESGLLLFASTGTGTVGRMAIIEQYNNDWAMSETLYAIKTKENLSSKYLMYFLYSENAKKQFEPKISKGSVPHLKVVDLLNVVIPIPHLSEQQRIVSILDTFEASIQNLEAQLKEREKQYEYYRNNLLKLE